MGFPRDHTLPCMPAAERRAHPEAYDDVRHSLVGNSIHAQVLAWIFGQVLAKWGVLPAPPTPQQVVGRAPAAPGRPQRGSAAKAPAELQLA
eukprot:10599917-Lingulodinium_polyedra.AAC.1